MLLYLNIYVVSCLSIETTRLRNKACRHRMLIFYVQTHNTNRLLLWVFSIREMIDVGVLKTVINVTGRIVFGTVYREINTRKQVTCKIQCNLITIEKISSIL